MNPIFLILGLLLLFAVIVDLLWTTLWPDGSAGPLSARLSTWAWRLLRRLGGRNSLGLSLAGPLILMLVLLSWVLLLWGGWTLLFAGAQHSLVDTTSQQPVDWAGRIYFVAYAMFTMGNGEYSPANGTWEIATSLTTASGMLLITMAVSYVLSVLSAVNHKRSFAGSVTGLGADSEELVRSGWNGQDLTTLDLPLSGLAAQLSTLAEQHKAYPVLHYYHSAQTKSASAVAVAILDEALTLLRFGVPDDCRPNTAIVESARATIAGYLDTLHSAFIEPASEAPPPPDLDRLRAAGIPTVSDEAFQQALDGLQDRRRRLLGMVRADAWRWPPENQ